MLTNIDPLADLELNIMGREVSNTQLALGAAAVGAFFLWRRNRGAALGGFWDDLDYDDRDEIRPGPWATKTAKWCVRLKRSKTGKLVCAKYANKEVLASRAAYKRPTTTRRCMKYSTSGGRRRCVRFGRVRITR